MADIFSKADQTTLAILRDLVIERVRQIERWGERVHLRDRRGRVVAHPGVEVGVVLLWLEIPRADHAKAEVDCAAKLGCLSWSAIAPEEFCEAIEAAASGDPGTLRTELVQCAAVFVAWIDALDRRGRSEQEHIEAAARSCRNCPECRQERPCPACLAGGVCDSACDCDRQQAAEECQRLEDEGEVDQ